MSAAVAVVLLSGLFVSTEATALNLDDLDGSFPPMLVYPADNSWINISAPTMQWRFVPEDPTDHQTGFTVQVDDSVGFESVDATSYDVSTGSETWMVSPPLSDGRWYWRVRVRDSYGEWSPYSAQRRFYIDASPPNTTLVFNGPNWMANGTTFVSSSTKLALSPRDTGIGYLRSLYRTWNGTWSAWKLYTGSFNLVSPEGMHFIEYYSVDKLWNIEAVKNTTLNLDNTPPNSNVWMAGKYFFSGGKYYIGPSTELEIEAVDAGAGVNSSRYKIENGPWVNYTGPFTFDGMTGMVAFSYLSIDNVGNTELEKSSVVYIDAKSPHTELTIGLPNYGSNPVYVNSSTLFGLTPLDDVTTVEAIWFKIDNDNWTRYSRDFTIKTQGQHFVYYNATDIVGNSEVPNHLKVHVDDTPPETRVNFDGPHFVDWDTTYITSRTVISLVSTDNGSGVKTVTYIVDMAVGPPYTKPFTISKAGVHTLKFSASDRLMNMETENIVSITVDDESPVTVLSISPKSSGSEPMSINLGTEFALSATDAVSGIAATFYRIDNGSWVQYIAPFRLDDLPRGMHTIHYYSVDNLGNPEDIGWIVVSTKQPVTTGSIAGKVIAGTEPLVNVTIFLGPNLTFITDSSGSFTCSNLQPGIYSITAIRQGYYNWTVEATVEAGEIAIVFIAMMEESPPPPIPPVEQGTGLASLPIIHIGLGILAVIAAALFTVVLMKRRRHSDSEGKEWLNNIENGLEDVVESHDKE